MATILRPRDIIQHLHCTCPAHGQLIYREDNKIECQSCKRVFIVADNILELVDPSLLDAETSRELKGNSIQLTEEAIRFWANRDSWSDYNAHMLISDLRILSRYLDWYSHDQIFALGCGTGAEIKCLARMHRLNTAYCSDLAYSALYILPYTLKDTDIRIGLFTSNLDDCPIKNIEFPLLINGALHHTADMHAAIERLLIKGYKYIYFIEPTDNFLIGWLSKRGIARRIEYSGVKPGRLNLKLLRCICKKHSYKAAVTTKWKFPEDYFRRYIKSPGLIENLFLFLIDMLSMITRPFRLGNSSVVFLQKK